MKRRALSAGLAVLVAGLAFASPASAATHIVHVFDTDFSSNPRGQPIVDPTIRVGDTVQWVWDSGFHTSTSVNGIPEQWNSGMLGPGGRYSHTFTNVGTWHYYCQPHGSDNGNRTASGMAGTIRAIVPEPATPALLAAAASCLLLRRRRPA